MPKTMSPDLLKALQGVCYIAQHIKDADKDKEVNIIWNESTVQRHRDIIK